MTDFAATMADAFADWVTSRVDVPFNPYAIDPTQMSWLTDLIPGIVVTSAGGFVPFQAEGLLHGLPFYYRERTGLASLSVGGPGAPHAYGPNPLWRAQEDVEELRGGRAWLDSLINLVQTLRPLEFRYEFAHREVTWSDRKPKNIDTVTFTPGNDNAPMTFKAARGSTPALAYERAATFEESAYLSGHGWSVDVQRRLHDAQVATMSSEPSAPDDRVWPDIHPTFAVTVPDTWRTIGPDGTPRIVTPWAPEKVEPSDDRA